jgi:hypothetical protein
MGASPSTVRPELVEGLSFFFFPAPTKEGQGFDRLSPNGVGRCDPNGISL